jgi:hypothetical protein
MKIESAGRYRLFALPCLYTGIDVRMRDNAMMRR